VERRGGDGGEHRAVPGPQSGMGERCWAPYAMPRTRCSGRCFNSIGIIITAYLPIFTPVNAWKAACFKPMAMDGIVRGY